MCGIFGQIAAGAVSNTVKALKYLEYRGYDSAGLALRRGDCLEMYKTEGRIATLERIVDGIDEATVAIGHTRWATHGAVSTANAHPFLSEDGNFAIVHNGIIENYRELKALLPQVKFTSQTDSETVAHLLRQNYRGDVLQTVLTTARMLKGSFAIAVLSVYGDKLYAVRNKSPLVVGFSSNGAYLCSDIRCISHWATSVAVAPDNAVAEIGKNGAKFFRLDGTPVDVKFFAPPRAEETESFEGDFMLKEIFEIPAKLRQAKRNYVERGGLSLDADTVRRLKRIYLIGCGTAYHSGLAVAAVARKFIDADVIPVVASEFIYDNYPVDGDTLAFLISQSGETADTVRAAERVTESGGLTYAVTNTDSSSLTFKCDNCVNICADGEFAVASTKAYNCQIAVLTMLFADIALLRGTLSAKKHNAIFREIDGLPFAVEQILDESYRIAQLAEEVAHSSAVFFIGRTTDYPTACEGSLKLKEISYIHSEAYPAGELKHGTLALMERSVTVVAISTDPALRDKMISSVNEVTSRGARVIAFAPYAMEGVDTFELPPTGELLYAATACVPLQLLAYYAAKSLGRTWTNRDTWQSR